MLEHSAVKPIRNVIEPKLLFRADVDQSGDWYVWRRLGTNGWATLQRCDDREHAIEMAKALNEAPPEGV